MKCPECNVQQLQGLTKPIKEGYLLKHKKRVFGRDWKENWVVLYEDSSLAWYKNRGDKEMPLGTIIIRDAPEMLAAGQYTFKIPGLPSLPPGYVYNQLMAFGSRIRDDVHWFLAPSADDVDEWMTAISNMLPLAPSVHSESQIREKNGEIVFYNNKGINIGNLYESMKPVLKKCKDCCTMCDYSTNCCMKESSVEKLECNQQTTSSKYKKLACECCTGLLMGHTMANVATGWRGWGEGIGWQVAGLCGTDYCQTAAAVSDHSMCLPSHDIGDVDYENGMLSNNVSSALTHEVTTVLDSTNDSTGFLSFDFFL